MKANEEVQKETSRGLLCTLFPPGPNSTLRLTSLGLSMNRVCYGDLRVPVTRIADIEKRAITADTALRFARYFNNSPTFWMNLQRVMTWKLPKMRLLKRLNAIFALWKQRQQGSATLRMTLLGEFPLDAPA
jgi:antitoxin HigA-1